jgi:hypothetical protein
MIFTLVHRAPHLALMHTLHLHAIFSLLPRRPISIDPGVLGTPAFSFPGLI